VNSENKTRLFGIRFQLARDERYESHPAMLIVVVTPYRIKQTIATQSLSWMRNEIGEESKPLGREVYNFA
jgi:hypothetical protein